MTRPAQARAGAGAADRAAAGMGGAVLLVDDDRAVRDALGQTLELSGYTVTACGSYIEAKDHISADFPGLVLTDVRMPGKDGFDLLRLCQEVDAELPVILLTGEGDIPMAVRGMTGGAFDFLEKPCERDRLLEAVGRAARTRALVIENRRLRRALQDGDAAARTIIGQSPAIVELRRQVRAVAATGAEVLICGAPGTGTARVAEVIHRLRGRRGPFLRVPAADWQGRDLVATLDSAAAGTLLIENLADLPPALQLQLAECDPGQTDTALIATMVEDPEQALRERRLDQDLFFRFDLARLHIPPLRERAEDIPVLFRHFTALAAEQAGVSPPAIPADLAEQLISRPWPGNTRELQNAAMRFALGFDPFSPTAASYGDNGGALAGDTRGRGGAAAASVAGARGLAARVASYERALIVEALQRHNGRASAAAEELGLPRKTFYDKLSRHGIRPERFRESG